MRYFVLALALACWAAGAGAQKVSADRTEQVRGATRLQVVDLTPRFLAFYEAARRTHGDARFALWRAHYDFAAVPPGPRGEQIARRLLDAGWPRYHAAMPRLRAGAANLGSEPIDTLASVSAALEVTAPLPVRLTTFVGAFDNNAFTSRSRDGTSIVYLPIEMAADRRRVLLPHEMTHAVHLQLANMSGDWERTIGATLLMEGLAVHVNRRVVPGLPEADYIEFSRGWWPRAQRQKRAILAGILPLVAESDPEVVFRFTVGGGSVGLEREAYAAGYWAVGQLLRDGMSLAQIARVPEAEMPALARRALEAALALPAASTEGP